MRVISKTLFAALLIAGSSMVQQMPLNAQEANQLPIRGVVRALNTAAISTDLVVPIKALPFREGQSFKKGDILVSFDCARLIAERATLQAERRIQSLTYQNNQTLLKHRAIGEFEVQISQAKVAKADAQIKRLEVRISQCNVRAPFDGRIEEELVRQYETPKSGVPYIKIIESGASEIELIVPSKWLAWLKIGAKFNFTVDETGKSFNGIVSQLGAAVDPVSQTVEVKGKLINADDSVLVGMSGAGQFDQPGS